VNEYVSEFLKDLILKDFPDLHKAISGKLTKKIKDMDAAMFCEFSALLTPMMISMPSTSLCHLCEGLLKKPVNLAIFEVASDMLSVKLESITGTGEREDELMTRIHQFTQLVSRFDGYALRHYYTLWMKLIKKHLGSERALRAMVDKFLTSAPRFFAPFCVFVKEIRRVEAPQIAKDMIEHAISLQTCATHICALEMLGTGANIREVLDIALLEADF
jgi:hypothetical protein